VSYFIVLRLAQLNRESRVGFTMLKNFLFVFDLETGAFIYGWIGFFACQVALIVYVLCILIVPLQNVPCENIAVYLKKYLAQPFCTHEDPRKFNFNQLFSNPISISFPQLASATLQSPLWLFWVSSFCQERFFIARF